MRAVAAVAVGVVEVALLVAILAVLSVLLVAEVVVVVGVDLVLRQGHTLTIFLLHLVVKSLQVVLNVLHLKDQVFWKIIYC